MVFYPPYPEGVDPKGRKPEEAKIHVSTKSMKKPPCVPAKCSGDARLIKSGENVSLTEGPEE